MHMFLRHLFYIMIHVSPQEEAASNTHHSATDTFSSRRAEPSSLTLVAADAFEADAAVAGSRHVVAGGVVHTLTQLLAAVTKRPRRTLCTGSRGLIHRQISRLDAQIIQLSFVCS